MPKSAAYPDGHVSTGEPVFQRLVPRLRVTFTYGLESELPVTADGRIALDARISDGRGWERMLPLAPERPFAPAMRPSRACSISRGCSGSPTRCGI